MNNLRRAIGLRAGKFGYLALAVALTEILIVWGGRSAAIASPELEWRWLRTVMIFAYGWGLTLSLGFSITGLIKDCRPPIPAIVALVLAIVNVDICSWPIAF